MEVISSPCHDAASRFATAQFPVTTTTTTTFFCYLEIYREQFHKS